MGGSRCAAHWAAWIALAPACAGPSLEVTTEPADALVYVDGRRFEGTAVPFRYYGTVAVDALPAVDLSVAAVPESRPAPVRELVEMPEPVTPWIFPLDFAGELVAWAFGGGRDRQARIVLPPEPDPAPDGEPPAGMDELASRARAARVAR